MATLLALFRVMMLCMLAISLYLSWGILTIFVTIRGQQEDDDLIKLWKAKVAQLHFRLVVRSCGLKIYVDQDSIKNLPNNRALILANHVNYLDVIAMVALHPMGFIAKQEVGHWPLIGHLVRFYNTIFVQREDDLSRLRCIRSLQEGTRNLCYGVFPQGTTSVTPYLDPEPWYAGQLFCLRDPGVRIFAVGLHYQQHERMAWVDDMTLAPHLWQTLKQKEIKVGMAFQEIIIDDLERTCLREVSELVRKTINLMCDQAAAFFAEKVAVETVQWVYDLHETRSEI